MINKLYGIALVSFVAISGTLLADFIGHLFGFYKSPISSVLMAILVGILIKNLIPIPKIFQEGIDFIVAYVLKLGIILLGIGISLFEILKVGVYILPIVLITIISGLLLAFVVRKLFNISYETSTLIGVGTSICGATAIATVSPIINAKKEESAYAITIIALFGTMAMSIYPFLVDYIFTTSMQKGVFLGTSIHDTSQVIGAGLIYSEVFNNNEVLDITTITKLLRNSFMLVVIPLIGYLYYKNNNATSNNDIKFDYKKAFPFFVIGFVLLAIIRSIGDFTIEEDSFINKDNWVYITTSLLFISKKIFLVLALGAIGLNVNIRNMLKIGYKPLVAGFFIAFGLAFINVVSIFLIIPDGGV